MRFKQSFRVPVRALFFLLMLALCVPTALAVRPMSQEAPQAPSQKPRALPPTQYIPSRDYGTRNITLNLRFDWEREQALGTAAITLAPLVTDLRRVEFDAANMTFTAVKLANGAPLRYETEARKEKLRVTLDRAYQPTDVLTLVIDYHTNGVSQEPGIGGAYNRGLTFIKPTPADPTRPRQIWSQGESEYNHYWFPCYDHPNDFATSELIATVEKPLIVISNGRLVATKDNADGTRTFHWKIDQPHASYLTSIVVGEYAPVETSYAGVPIFTYVYPSEVEPGKITAARLGEMVKFFSEKTGLKYPYAKYAQTVTRDFGGGMENISATTQTDQMVHDARTELDQTSDSLQSHELAHQWFGDYVTCRSWADIWLNESFATYFQALWDEHSLGHDDFLYRDVKGNQDQYYTAWKNNQRRPIVTKNYRDPDAVFDVYAYPRGGAVLHMLRKTLGDDNWWRAINHYLNKYAHQPVETEQFRIAIEEATGQSMDWFFDEWLYKMGHPVFRVTQTYDPSAKRLSLTVRQEQKPDPDSAYPQAGFFKTPVDIEIGTNNSARIERVMIEPTEEQTFNFTVDSQPLLVNFDYGDTLIKELKFEKPVDALVYQLERDEDVTGRIWALGQLTERMKGQATADPDKQRIAEVIGHSLTNDKFWGMRFESAAALSGIPGTAARAALIAATKDQNARVRARAVTALVASKDPALASVYQGLLNDPSYSVIRAAALALGSTKSPAAYEPLVKLLDVPSWRDNIRGSALGGLAALGDRRALDIGIRYAASTNPAQVRAGAVTLLGAIGKDDPRVFPLISEAFLQAVSSSNQTLGSASAEVLMTLGDPRTMQVIDQARKRARSPFVQAALNQLEQRLRQGTQAATPKPSQ